MSQRRGRRTSGHRLFGMTLMCAAGFSLLVTPPATSARTCRAPMREDRADCLLHEPRERVAAAVKGWMASDGDVRRACTICGPVRRQARIRPSLRSPFAYDALCVCCPASIPLSGLCTLRNFVRRFFFCVASWRVQGLRETRDAAWLIWHANLDCPNCPLPELTKHQMPDSSCIGIPLSERTSLCLVER